MYCVERCIRSYFHQSAPRWFSCARASFPAFCLSLTLAVIFNPALLTQPVSADESNQPASNVELGNSDSTKRYKLKGKTAVTDFKLNDLGAYKAGMVAFEKKNFSGAEILFKQASAQLDDGYEKYRAECLFFQAKCLMMNGKADDAAGLFRMAAKLFEEHDPKNPYMALASAQEMALSSGATGRTGNPRLRGGAMTQHVGVSIDQHITLASGISKSDPNSFLLRVDKESIPKTVHNCFAEMTCLETAEIGSNINNAVGRWQPLLVQEDPAALSLGASAHSITIKLDGQPFKINLPTFKSLRKILLATDNEKICAMDLDSYESWLLRIKRNKDGTLNTAQWVKLAHVKPNRTATASTKTITTSSSASSQAHTTASGWDSKPKKSSGWDSTPRSRSSWGNTTKSNSGWGNNGKANSAWSSSLDGNYNSLPTTEPRYSSREGRSSKNRSSGF